MISKNRNQLFSFGDALVLFVCITVAGGFGAQALAQQKANSGRQGTAAQNAQRSADEGKKDWKFAERDSPEQVREREKWFYKQRAFPLGRIPAGALFRGFLQKQRMMEAEGKLVRRSDGRYVPALAAAALVADWSPIGPAPTNSGFFGPVSGRVTTIAVDPTDTTGNTVLIGGAQGGIWRTTDGGTSWASVGDLNPSQAMGSIAFAPSNASIVYAGTGEQASTGFDVYYGAGVLKSTDGGVTWNPTCPTPGPTCDNPFIGPFSSGFFPGGGARISYIAVNPTNPNLVLAGVQIFTGTDSAGVYCSDDGGLHWTNKLAGQMATFVGFGSSTVAYAALGRPFGSSSGSSNTNGIFKSTNAGGTCAAMTFNKLTINGTGAPSAAAIGRIDIGIFDASTIYASISDATTFSSFNLGVWKTADGGTNWTKTAAPDFCAAQCWYDNVVKVHPTNSSMVFVGGSAVFSGNFAAWVQRTTNAGTSWSPILPDLSQPGGIGPGLPHVDVHAFGFVRVGTKLRMYMGNDGGMWRTDDAEAATVTWTNINGNLQLSQFYPSLSIHPSNASFGFAGTQDNGSQNYTGSPTWDDNLSCGDGGWTTIDPVIPSTVYVNCQFISIQKSVVNGSLVGGSTSFFFALNGIDFNDDVNFIPPLVLDAASPQRLYFGTSRVWQTTDGANNWTAISGDLSTIGGVISTLAAGGGGSVVYAGTDDGLVFVATNVAPGTGTFNNRTSGLPPRSITQLAVDPADPSGNTAYVTVSGFSGFGNQQGHIFKTINAGVTWLDVSCTAANCGSPNATDLPNIPVNDLVVDPDVPGALYAATDLGVFTSINGGATWTTLGTTLPNVAVFSLRLHRASRTLRAATHGRGAWDFALDTSIFAGGPHISSISPTSKNVGDTSFTLTVTGSGLAPGGVPGTIQWNGATANVTQGGGTDTQLTATIASPLVAAAGAPQVTVTTGAQTSNALTFTVLGAAPVLTSINPTSTPVQTPNPTAPVTITLNGSNFNSGTQTFFDGAQNGITTSQTASCQPPSCFTATLPAALLGPFGGTHDITAVNPPPGGGASAPQTFVVVAPPPANDAFTNATNITANGSDTVDSSGATQNTGGVADPTPSCAAPFGVSNTVWYKFTAPTSGTVSADTSGSSYDTVLSTWTGSAGSLSAVSGGCSDDIVLGVVLTSQISFNATSGTTYFIMMSSFGDGDPNPVAFGGKSVLNFAFTPTPDFTLTAQAPTSVTVSAGSPASFTIALAAQNGFSGTVNFTCSLTLTAAHTTCTPNPASQTPGNNVTVNVTTTARGGMPPAGPWRVRPRPILVPLLVVVLALLILLTRVRARRVRLALSLPLAVLVLLLVFQAVGCGGGGGGGGGTTGTPAGTYTVTVTGTSGTTSHNTTVTLVVN